MKRKFSFVLVMFLMIILFIPGVLGHVPVDSEENTTLERAQEIKEPSKSWAIYDELHEEGEGKYYFMHLKKGDRLYASLLTPDDGNFAPNLLIMGPGLGSNDSVPVFVEVEEYLDRILFEAEKEDAEYEPFTPASNYPLAEYDQEVNESGTYYIVVFSGNSNGRFILAVGYQESFTVIEWLKVPLDLINIYLWSGHGILIVILPFVMWLLAGTYILLTKVHPGTVNTWILAIGGLMYMGSATLTTIEMGIAVSRSGFGAGVIVTLIFILIPAVLGSLIILRIMRKERLEKSKRIAFLIYGILGLLLWAGVIVGPVLVTLGSVLPIIYVKKEVERSTDEEKGSEKEDDEPEEVMNESDEEGEEP